MNEELSVESVDRFNQMRRVAERAKQKGLSRRDRRELVISSLARERLDQESPEVQEAAIGKYFVGGVGSKEIRGMVDSLHSSDPGDYEAASILKGMFPQVQIGTLAEYYRTKSVGSDVSTRLDLAGVSEEVLVDACKEVWKKVERPVEDMVRLIAGEHGASWWVAKKSRLWTDANRRSFFHEPRGVKVRTSRGTELLQTKEYPTSAEAALYWVTRRTVEKTVGLDDDGKLRAPFLRLALHGMVNREHADIVLGGGGKRKFVSEKVLTWFGETLARKLNERKVRVTTSVGNEDVVRCPIVAIHRTGKSEAEIFQYTEGEVERKDVHRDGDSLSGAGLGLEYFREGNVFQVEDVDGNPRELEFPGFGLEFHTIQTEMSNGIRKNLEAREQLEEIFTEMMVEFSGEFSELGSSIDSVEKDS